MTRPACFVSFRRPTRRRAARQAGKQTWRRKDAREARKSTEIQLQGVPNGPKKASPNELPDSPRRRHGPKEAQDDPKTGPEVAKTRPRQAQEGPKSAQEAPKRGQDELQRPSRRASKGDLAGRGVQMRKSAFRFDGSTISGGRRVAFPARNGVRIRPLGAKTGLEGGSRRDLARHGARRPEIRPRTADQGLEEGSGITAARIRARVLIDFLGQTCVRSS